ncbi:putative RNA-directed DNA polymerase [Helianthus anomalus]
MLIVNTVSEESFQHVQGHTSREVWLSLERAYAPVSSSHEFTLKSQLLRITMKGDEKLANYLARAQEYATALANIGEPMKDKDLVILTVTGLREEYNGLKANLLARSPPVTFTELHGLLSDHDYMITKILATTQQVPHALFAAVTTSQQPLTAVVPTPPQPNIDSLRQQLHSLQLMASQLGYQLNPTSSSQPQAYFGSRSFNNNRGNRGSRGSSRGNSRGGQNNRNQANTSTRQFSWASTQNTINGHCNRCGIGHLPSQCLNQPNQSRAAPQANYVAHSDVASQSGFTWKPDTGCNGHATPDLSSIDNSEAYFGNDSLLIGDGNPLPIFHIGSSTIYSPNKTFKLSNILHVPDLKQNLLSVQKFCVDNDVFFEFHSSYFVVKDESTRTTLLTGPSEQGLYSIRLPQLKSIPKVAFTAVKTSSSIWHQRLGHPHAQVFRSIISHCSLPITDKFSNTLCTPCQLGKSSKLSLSDSSFRSKNLFDLVYCDVWGPSPALSVDGCRFFLLCVDHYSRYMWFYPLAQKSDVYNVLTNFIKLA